MKKVRFSRLSMLMFLVMLCGGTAPADIIPAGDVPDSFAFLLKESKDQDPEIQKLLKGFQVTVSKNAGEMGAVFTLGLTQAGYDAGYDQGKDRVKFEDFAVIGGEEFFGNNIVQWDDVWMPVTGTLDFEEGIEWRDFAANIEKIFMTAHIKSIYTPSKDGISINEGEFKLSAVPEPATLLIIGVGSAGLAWMLRKRLRAKNQRVGTP